MKRCLIALMVVSSMAAIAKAADAPDLDVIQRMRIVLDLMKDGDVTTPAAYAQCDLIDPATGVKWVDPLIWAHRPQYREQLDAGTLTNQQKAALMLNIFRQFFLDAKKARDASLAADAARNQAITDVTTEGETELGQDETVPESP